MYGGPGDDALWGGTDNDKGYGDDGADAVEGETGDDHHDGGGDPGDSDYCGPGIDTYNPLDDLIHPSCEAPLA
jgi:hypothetical protein